MAKYSILFSKLAEEKFESIIQGDRKLGERLAKAIDRIAAHPELGKLLSGDDWKGCRKYRSGDYRIIYRAEHLRLVIYILTLGNRKGVYK